MKDASSMLRKIERQQEQIECLKKTLWQALACISRQDARLKAIRDKMTSLTKSVNGVLVEAVVTKVMSNPRMFNTQWKFGWIVGVEYEDEDGISREALYFDTKEEALAVKEGYRFTH